MLQDNINNYSSTIINESEDLNDEFLLFRKPSMVFASFQNSRQLLPGMRDLQGYLPHPVTGLSPPPSPSGTAMRQPSPSGMTMIRIVPSILPSSPNRLIIINETDPNKSSPQYLRQLETNEMNY